MLVGNGDNKFMKLTIAQKTMLEYMFNNDRKVITFDQRRMRTLRVLREFDLVTLRVFDSEGKMGMKSEITRKGINAISQN